MTVIDEQEDHALANGDIVAGRYRVLRVLGHGATGIVYEAEHQWTRRRVALKVLRSELSTNERVVERFLREARVCAELSHPALVAVLDMGQDEHDGLLYLAQELVEGQTLRALLDERSPLREDEALAVVSDIAEALSEVHAAGLVHRDVKPENIIVSTDDATGGLRSKLIDFGIAREVERDAAQSRTQLGALLGTPRYMSPEQARATGEIDARSDQYALAVVAYECLTGGTPHDGASTPLLLAALLTEPARAIDRRSHRVSPGVSAAVMRALSASPGDRFDTVRAFVDALRAPPKPRARGVSLALGVALFSLLALGGARLATTSNAAVDAGAAPDDATSMTPSASREDANAPTEEVVANDALAAATEDRASARDAASARAPAVSAVRAPRRTDDPPTTVAVDPAPRTPVEATDPEDVSPARPALRPATFGDASSWLRPATVR